MRKLLSLFLALVLSIAPVLSQSGIYVRPDDSTLPSPVTFGTWLFNSSNGQIYVWDGAAFLQITPPHAAFAATVDPTTSNDQTEGYTPGSFWLNINGGRLFNCADATTGAAVWNLVSTDIYNAANIPGLLQTGLSTGDFAGIGLLPSVPGSGLDLTLPAGTAYVNGQQVNVPSTMNTYTASKWTYDFILTDGTMSHITQNIGTLPPVVANSLLGWRVVTDATDITSVDPWYTVPATLRNYMIPPPGSSGLVFQTDTTNPLGLKYGSLLLTSLDTGTATTGNTIVFNGVNWVAGALDTSGGGTGLSTLGTANQVVGVNNGATATEWKSIVAGSNVTITNTPGQIQIAASGSGSATLQSRQDGRLYLVTGQPYADAGASSTLYFGPDYSIGNLETYWDGAAEQTTTLSEISLPLSGLTTGVIYDIYVNYSSGFALSTVAWSGNTPPTRDTQDGRLVKHSNPDFLLVGAIKAASATTTIDDSASRWVSNLQNAAPRSLTCADSNNTWAQGMTALTSADGDTTDGIGRVSFVQVVARQPVKFGNFQTADNNVVNGGFQIAIGFDSTSVASAEAQGTSTTSNATQSLSVEYTAPISTTLGYHYLQRLEGNPTSVSTATFFGGGVFSGGTGLVWN
jgi:hypothetical protein